MMKQYKVIGYPIAHSLSPRMHNEHFKLQNIAAFYDKLELKELHSNIQLLQQLDGFNVTVPHKETIIDYLDEIDELAQKIGAVNTVVCRQGKLMGYNTDALGFYKSFATWQVPTSASILIVGAGGAAKAVYYALQRYGYEHLMVANRTLSNATAFASHVVSLEQASELLETVDVLINTTSVGLVKGECPLELRHLCAHTKVMDLIYKPAETTLLTTAKQRGCDIKNGLEMLAYQGALAFEKWYEQQADEQAMIKVLQEALQC